MKKSTFCCTAIAFTLITSILLSCTNTQKNNRVYSASIAGNGKSKKPADNDLRFLVNAYSNGLFKINLAVEAQIRSTSAECRQLANAIVSFHNVQNNQIEEIAAEHGFTLPGDLTDDQKKQWKQLIKEKGWAFDKKFAEMINHFSKEDLTLYDQAIRNSTEEFTRILAQKAQPELTLHETLKTVLNERIEERAIVLAEGEPKENSKSKTRNKQKALIAKI